MPLMTQQRARVISYIGPSPDVASWMLALTALLQNVASFDSSKLCDYHLRPSEWRGDEFLPQGAPQECRARYARKDGSGFRNGLGIAFTVLKERNRKDIANELVPYLTDMIVAQTNSIVGPSEARDIVWKEYGNAMGHVPPPPGGAPDMTTLDEGDDIVVNGQPEAANGEIPWLLIGVGAVAIIGGGIFLMTRRKK